MRIQVEILTDFFELKATNHRNNADYEVQSKQIRRICTAILNSPFSILNLGVSPLIQIYRGEEAMPPLPRSSPKVVHRAAEHAVVVVAGHVDIQVDVEAHALGVRHLAEHPAVGGGDALDGGAGAVGIRCVGWEDKLLFSELRIEN